MLADFLLFAWTFLGRVAVAAGLVYGLLYVVHSTLDNINQRYSSKGKY